MLSNLQTWTVIGLTGIIWIPVSLVGWVNGGPAVALWLSDGLAAVLIAMSAFERWLWRWRPLHPHLVGQPVVGGTWRGTLVSLWVNPTTGESPAPKPVYLAIRQTLSTIWVRLLTDESSSDQMAGKVDKDPASGDWVISYTFVNTPHLRLRPRSPMHRGGAHLRIFGEPPARIEGEYWTERAQGTLVMDEHRLGVAQAYQDAVALFERPAPQE